MKVLIFIMLLIPVFCYSAEYKGNDIDGIKFDCTAYSYSTSKYYYLQCEFDGDDVIIYFKNGGKLRLSLDEEEIEDSDNISAFDYNKSVYWDLGVDLSEYDTD